MMPPSPDALSTKADETNEQEFLLNIGASLADQVATWIANRIIEGKLQPGEELGIRPLAEKLGVSPTPIREALRSLQSEGLIELPPRRSPRVAKLTKKDVLDIYSCRAYLNSLVAKLASEQMTSGVLEQLELIVNEMTQAVGKDDVGGYFQLTVRFNEVLVDCARNQVLRNLLQSLGRRTLRLRYLSITVPGRLKAGLEFHHELLDAFRNEESERAEHLMMRQIVNAQEVLLESAFLDDEALSKRSSF
jgi:DNA-binding GntR family transcriptional regulator